MSRINDQQPTHLHDPNEQSTQANAVSPGPLPTATHHAANEPDPETVVSSNSSRTPLPGDLPRIPGYEILDRLGQGGMGVVYKARQIAVNRIVALKVLPGGSLSRPLEQARFQIEAEAVAALQHPAIVQLFEYGQAEGTYYLTLEYVEGGTLAERLQRGRLTPRQAAELVQRLATAIHAAHLKAILHRDLKPGNVLLTESGKPKITDFGLARVGTSDLTQPGAVMGTPFYMSPEQAAGEVGKLGTTTDVWGLGAILYELLTGGPPFRHSSVASTIAAVINDNPVPPRQRNRRVPRDLEQICLKCLQKDPADRYPTAEALAADLNAFLHGYPVAARPIGRVRRTWKWVRRHPTRTALLVSLLGVGIAIGTLLPRYQSAQELAQTRTNLRKGVWVERDANAEAAFKVVGQEAVVYKYTGGTVDFWIELTPEGKDQIDYRLGGFWWSDENRGVRPDQIVEGTFVWMRGARDKRGYEEWKLGHRRIKTTHVRSGGEIGNAFGSVRSEQNRSNSAESRMAITSQAPVWSNGSTSGTWSFGHGAIQNPIPSDQALCLREMTGGEMDNLDNDGAAIANGKKRGYLIRIMCKIVDEETDAK